MDANRTKFWMLADVTDWNLSIESSFEYVVKRRCLRLRSQRFNVDDVPFGQDGDAVPDEAITRVARVPQAIDAFGHRARWDETVHAVSASGAVPGETVIFKPPTDETPSDLAMGYDGVLYMAMAGRVVLQDRRNRWSPVSVSVPGFDAWRLAADPGGGVWVLDRTHRRLGRVRGLPLPHRPYGEYSSDTFRPDPEDPDPPRLDVVETAVWPEGEEPVGVACNTAGRVAVLNWVPDGLARVRTLDDQGRWNAATDLRGARRPFSLSWVSDREVAVLLTTLTSDAPVYPVAPGDALPAGDFYPLRHHDGGPFLNGVVQPPHFPTASGSSPLHHLSLPSFARTGQTQVATFDSGNGQTVWHRLYLETNIPPRCGIVVRLAAGNRSDGAIDDVDWHEHRFGEVFHSPSPGGNVPRGAWVPYPSEIPHHEGFLDCTRTPNRAGLFTALIQRSNRPVRALRGRYLHVQVEMFGDGLTTPELWAVRAYAPRFSYADNYLPALYRESLFGEDAEQIDRPATRADFLSRFLGNFEGMLTTIEDRIADAYLLTDPQTASDDSLPWLARWIGLDFEPGYPDDRRRDLLRAAPELYRRHGTYRGLALALDVATQNAVSGGRIVIIENFRLRRTFATILGADLVEADDPLVGSFAAGGNSFVGDTLFLGDEHHKEFLAVFAADLDVDQSEHDAIAALFDRLAYRVTVLVHEDVDNAQFGLIRRVAETETPAHVRTQVVRATHPFLVAIASLVGVDTFLRNAPDDRAVRVGESHVGVRDRILRPASLDPRLEAGGGTTLGDPPTADAGDGFNVEFGQSFILDGSRSSAAEGRSIVSYVWSLLE